jgi:uncharacterized protein YfaS (alpha-2-macroglobulin family)
VVVYLEVKQCKIFLISVKVQPKKQYLKPSEDNEIEVEIKNYEGILLKNSEVTLMVVDEAVLSLTG